MSLFVTSLVLADDQLASSPSPDPLTPWATPQYFTDFQNSRFNHPRLAQVNQDQPLAVQSKGEAVERVQSALLDMGFALPAGADGDFGLQTEAALRAFQSSRSLPASGLVDKATLAALDRVAPQPGKKIWQDASASRAIPKAPFLGGKHARVLVDLSEHRLVIYSSAGVVQRVFPIASGARVTPTHTGIKVVQEKIANPKPIAERLWPESKGAAFGTRMIDLSWYEPNSGVRTNSGEELHGTYVSRSIGCNASHGCLRLDNENIEWVYQNLKVGDLVVIQD